MSDTDRDLLALLLMVLALAAGNVLVARVVRGHDEEIARLRAETGFLRDLARAAERSEP